MRISPLIICCCGPERRFCQRNCVGTAPRPEGAREARILTSVLSSGSEFGAGANFGRCKQVSKLGDVDRSWVNVALRAASSTPGANCDEMRCNRHHAMPRVPICFPQPWVAARVVWPSGGGEERLLGLPRTIRLNWAWTSESALADPQTSPSAQTLAPRAMRRTRARLWTAVAGVQRDMAASSAAVWRPDGAPPQSAAACWRPARRPAAAGPAPPHAPAPGLTAASPRRPQAARRHEHFGRQ